LNELHGIVVDALALADVEYGNNVGMVQPSRGPRLAAKPLQVDRIFGEGQRQHLQSHMPAQRFLHRLKDYSHAAPADLPNDPIIAQLLENTSIDRYGSVAGEDGLGFGGARFFDHDQGGEELANFLRQVRMLFCVLGQGRPLAAAITLDKLLGQLIHRVPTGLAHAYLPHLFYLSARRPQGHIKK
jgi:hypothetical protein